MDIFPQYVAKHRRTWSVKLIANVCQKFLNCYENRNYNPRSNGELFVYESMSNNGPSCIFDVGANVGEWTLMIHKIFPHSEIHAFEVVKPTFEKLKENTKDIMNITVNNCGLSDKQGIAKVRYFPDNPTLATMTEYPHGLACSEITGLVMTGDSYIERHGIEHVDILKIDVEGAENLVLHGLSQTIGSGRIDVIQFEYGKVNILTKYLLRDFYMFFEEKGYVVGKIYPNYVDFGDYDLGQEDFRGPNYLAIRKDRSDLISKLYSV